MNIVFNTTILIFTLFSVSTFAFKQLEFKSEDHTYKIDTIDKKFKFISNDLAFHFPLNEKTSCQKHLKKINNQLVSTILVPSLMRRTAQKDSENANSYFTIDGEIFLFKVTKINIRNIQRAFNQYYKNIFNLKKACQ